MFGTTAATGYLINSSTSITATSPAEAAGTVDVTVTGSAGPASRRAPTSSPTPIRPGTRRPRTTAPSARYGYAEAYDPATGQTILFGGFTAAHVLQRHLGLERGQLEYRSPSTSPSSREFAAMAYKPGHERGELLLFGGYNGTSYYNDTWAWNGSTSSQVRNTGDTSCTTTCTNSPSDRDGASMAYDPGTGQLVLFGGNDGGPSQTPGPGTARAGPSNRLRRAHPRAATPRWPTTRARASSSFSAATTAVARSQTPGPGRAPTWTEQSAFDEPRRPHDASMAYDPGTGQLVLFGGRNNGTTYYSDTWDWNGATWGQLAPTSGPSARLHSHQLI